MRWQGYTTIVMALVLPFLLLPAGCGGGEGAITEIVLSPLVLQDSFALYYPVPSSASPRVPPYQVSPDLSNVAGVGDALIPPGANRWLAEKSFLVVPGGESQMYQVYQDRPGGKFVTVDALLHAFYALYDYSLRDMEKRVLLSDLEGLIGSLYDNVARMYRGSEGVVREAALQDLVYLGVAARLLGIDMDIPGEVDDDVEKELELISGHTGTVTSPLFGYREDYSQYVPRGHYSGDPDLERYFRAMTWLGRMGFYPDLGTTPAEIINSRGMTRQALLLVGALHMGEVDGEPALKVWDRIYQASSFMVGFSDDLDVCIYTRLAGEVFGWRFPLSRLGDDAAVDDFIDRAVAEQSSPAGPGGKVAEGDERDISFRLFGRRFVPDSYIFQQLVANKVVDRFMPRGLDVPAAFGSDRALEILDKVYGETRYEGYGQNMQELRRELASIDPAQVHSGVYWSWMDTLGILLKPCGDGYPAFMRGTAWQERDLYAFLGSWAEMGHGTILYSKQIGTGRHSEGPASTTAVKGYVEPRPEAFARLAAIVDMLRRGLADRGLAGAAVQERMDALYQLLLNLKTMAEKELRNDPLAAEEYQAIAGIGDSLQYLATFPLEGLEEQSSETDPSLALVSDVHTDPNYGEVLEVAVGRPAVYYVIAPVEGRPTLTVGAGFSYYEFVKPVAERLTDEAWRGMLDAGQVPEPLAWTAGFLQK